MTPNTLMFKNKAAKISGGVTLMCLKFQQEKIHANPVLALRMH